MNDKNALPVDFDGVFRFTNFTDSEFKAKWNNVEYTFPPKKTVPMIIPMATPEEVQHIRKKFAKELAIQEFYQSKELKNLNKMNPVGQTAFAGAITYSDNDLKDYIQQCLVPLPVAQAKITQAPKQDESVFKTDKKGKKVTKILDEGESLLNQGSGAIE